jgi:hypothetical protein
VDADAESSSGSSRALVPAQSSGSGKPSSSMLPPSRTIGAFPRPRPNTITDADVKADSKTSSSSSVKTWNQFSKSNPPPVTITGVAPWAVAANRPSHSPVPPSLSEHKSISSAVATTLARSSHQRNYEQKNSSLDVGVKDSSLPNGKLTTHYVPQ